MEDLDDTPAVGRVAFRCPFCQAYAQQMWVQIFRTKAGAGVTKFEGLLGSQCVACEQFAIWYGPYLLYPGFSPAPLPNPDMPDDLKRDFNEARVIVRVSPRGAAALLRLAIQKLCKELGESGKHLDTDIKNLVAKGLDVGVQQALDTVRVIGNESVHPGQIDLRDDQETAHSLFELVNGIVDDMITRPKQRAEMYGRLPQQHRDRIAQRDAPKS